MAASHPGEEQLCSCQALQTTKAEQVEARLVDKQGAILVDIQTKLGQLFSFPLSLSRGNALRIHTRTQTTASLLWGAQA